MPAATTGELSTAMDVKIFFSACGAAEMTGNEQELIINIY